MAELRTLTPDGRLTAAVASQISDGAAALVIASGRAVEQYGLEPLARIHTMTVVGADPLLMLSAPIPATELALKKAGLTIEDIDHVEINEAFAPVVLAWMAETGADAARVNPLGGAIALGHPLGATGARLMTTMVHQLRRTGGRYGLQTMCEGGGMANATIVEAV
jgi:acetyl-CoA C-acetyltransferase